MSNPLFEVERAADGTVTMRSLGVDGGLVWGMIPRETVDALVADLVIANTPPPPPEPMRRWRVTMGRHGIVESRPSSTTSASPGYSDTYITGVYVMARSALQAEAKYHEANDVLAGAARASYDFSYDDCYDLDNP